MARLRAKIFKGATPTFKVPCPPFKQSFDSAILSLRFDNYLYFRPSNCLVSHYNSKFRMNYANVESA